MAIIHKANTELHNKLFSGSSCAFGVFDGVHTGHQFLLECARNSAQVSGGKSIALTFDIDPDEVFHPQRLKKLMNNDERLKMLANSGVDMVIALPFTPSFSASTPDEFLIKTFNGYPPADLHVGHDFRFGVKASGTVVDLDAWGREVGTRVHGHDLKSADDDPITATRIRKLLAKTDIEEANRLLGRPYYVTGIVKPGRGEGNEFGFRTANLELDPQMQVLGDGTYAGYVTVDDKRYKAAVAVGVSPVFEEKATATCEAHLVDFEGDLYDKEIKIEFITLLRPMIKFDSVDELVAAVKSNIAWVRENL